MRLVRPANAHRHRQTMPSVAPTRIRILFLPPCHGVRRSTKPSSQKTIGLRHHATATVVRQRLRTSSRKLLRHIGTVPRGPRIMFGARDGARLRADILADDNDLRADDATPDEASDLRAITSSERASDRRADRVPRRPYHGSVRRLRIHRGLGVRLALLRGNRLCVLPHVRRDVRSVLHGGGAHKPAPTAAPMRASGAPTARPSPAPSAPTALPTFGRTGVVQIILAPHDRERQ